MWDGRFPRFGEQSHRKMRLPHRKRRKLSPLSRLTRRLISSSMSRSQRLLLVAHEKSGK